jgi:serine phosphatase RsbU (regulator of sigma subunit)/anti-sigma regulatory factor (Ser/Thr protein kinase)
VELSRIFPVRNAGIGLLSDDQKSLEIVAFHSILPDEKSALGIRLAVEPSSHTRQVIDCKKTLVIQDAQHDRRTGAYAEVSRTRGTKSIMIVPLLARGDAIGTIGLPAIDPDYVFSESEIELAETVAGQIATTIDNARLYARVEAALNVAEHDLEIGRQIQAGFIPDRLPVIPGWEIAAHFEPARQVAGDFYDVFQFDNPALTAFVIADVCDKGVGAAFFMVLTRSLLRAFSAMQTGIDEIGVKLLNTILCTNDYIAETHERSNMFATLFFGVLDASQGILYYVNAGHEPPAMLDKEGTILARLTPTGPAVGLFPGMSFEVRQVQMQPGDTLVAFTDGVTDAKNRADVLFSEERLMASIAAPWTSVFSLVFELHTELHNHIGGQPQFDDITFLAFRHNLTEDPVRHGICRAADITNLGEMRDFVAAVAEKSGLEHEDVFAFRLAADEACVNILQHGYAGREPGYLAIFFEIDGDCARLTINDDGMYFSPEMAAGPDLESDWRERKSGGLGVHFVKQSMDRIEYHRTERHYNQLILERKIKPQAVPGVWRYGH